MDDALRQATLAVLRQELEAIHLANTAYWGSVERNHEAHMEHQLRQERLERIRDEMDELEARNRSSA
jgi:hypothetical protein